MTTYATAIHTHEREIAYLESQGYVERVADERKRLDATRSVMRANRKSPSATVTTREKHDIADAWFAAVPPVLVTMVSA